jgi:hypothetical protein
LGVPPAIVFRTLLRRVCNLLGREIQRCR